MAHDSACELRVRVAIGVAFPVFSALRWLVAAR
jgi:hypothetical protein